MQRNPGQVTPAGDELYLNSPYLHITARERLVVRNIRAQVFCWQATSVIERIVQYFDERHCATAVALYTVLTMLASRQRTPHLCHTSATYLGQQVKVSESTARRYLREFEQLGIIAVSVNAHAANTYVLLGEMLADAAAQPDVVASPLTTPTMPLADKSGQSRVTRTPRGSTHATPVLVAVKGQAVIPAPPQPLRGVTGDTPDRGMGVTGDSQVITRESNKPEEQPTTRVGVADRFVAKSDRDERTPAASTQIPHRGTPSLPNSKPPPNCLPPSACSARPPRSLYLRAAQRR